MHIAICDDNRDYMERLRLQVKAEISQRLPTDTVTIDIFTAGDDFLAAHADKKFDLIFLDVQMDEMDGFSIAERIKAQNNRSIIIFVSSYPKYAVKSFRFRPFWFLDKGAPDFGDDLNLAIDAVTKEYISKKAVYHVSYNRQDFAILVDDIIYITYAAHGLEIITQNGEYRKYGKMDDAEAELKPYGFIRTHSSYMVNPKHIIGADFDKERILKMRGGYKIPISRPRKQEVKAAFLDFASSFLL